jgi:hypothetical protein
MAATLWAASAFSAKSPLRPAAELGAASPAAPPKDPADNRRDGFL